jgi:hypothetical protein
MRGNERERGKAKVWWGVREKSGDEFSGNGERRK